LDVLNGRVSCATAELIGCPQSPRARSDAPYPFLARCNKWITFPPMKLALAVLVYALIGLVLSWGILLLLSGKPWLFLIAFLAYIVAFGKIGCKET
jgi:hypothetical protein